MNVGQSDNSEASPGAPGMDPEGGAAPRSMGVPPMGVHEHPGAPGHATATASAALPLHSNSQLPTSNSSAELRSADPFFSGRKHFPALDGLRGIAVLLVLVCHYSFWLAPPNRALAFAKLMSFQGWIGVNLFFVLSGFLITGILLDSKGQQYYYRNFYARRFLRIFPLYYGVLLAVLLVIIALRAVRPGLYSRDHNAHAILAAMPWFWTYTTNIGLAFFYVNASWLTHFWSLAVEEQFYLVWPLAVLVLTPRRLIAFCAALAVLALACRAGLTLAGAPSEANYFFTPCQLDSLAMGAVAAVVARDPALLAPLRNNLAWISGALLLLIGAVLLAGPFLGFVIGPIPAQAIAYGAASSHTALKGRSSAWALDAFPTLLALGFAATVLYSSLPGTGVLKRAISCKPLRITGGYAYGIYVYHLILLELVAAVCFRIPRIRLAVQENVWCSILFILANVLLTSAVAFASYHLYEKHFLKLKKYFPERGAASAENAGVGS